MMVVSNEQRSLLEADVVIVGAGSAGAAVALHCARRHLEVICLDRKPLEQAGPQWANKVPAWAFDAAHLARPRQPELLAGAAPVHLIAGWGPHRLVLDDHDLLEVAMPRLIERLRRQAQHLGARFYGEVGVEKLEGEVLHTSAGEIRARWVVDASGLGGAGLMSLPTLDREDICSAMQEIRRIEDLPRAKRFFAEHDVPWGEVLNFTGIEGGYSVLVLHGHGEHLHLLTGSIPGMGYRSGRKILRDFLKDKYWIGESVVGGSAPIPLRRPVSRLGEGRVAVVGDAACQVFSAHGSGVGAGLVAARILAEALAAGEGVEGYSYRWQRQFGGLFAAYDLFRRYSSRLEPRELERMMTSGLLHPEIATLGLRQQSPLSFSPAVMNPKVLVTAPDLLLTMGGVATAMARAALLYQRYPRDPARVEEWAGRVDRLFGEVAL